MKIGIIGAENSHTAAIAQIVNVEERISGCSVTMVWGETRAFARAAAKAGRIPRIVADPNAMLGKIDALIVDHRHPRFHLKAALPFIKAGIPAFIDKPFCYRVAEGKEFLRIAKRHKAAVTSFSILPRQKSFARFVKTMGELGKIVSGDTYGPCDLKSPYGGVFFYGIHQVDAALRAFGYDVSGVQVIRNGPEATGQLFYRDGRIVTMHLIKEGCPGFSMTAVGAARTHHQALTIDKNPYLGGVKSFTTMFKTGQEPESAMQMLRPIQVLEALQRSVKSGRKEKVIK